MTAADLTCWTLIRDAAGGDAVARDRFARNLTIGCASLFFWHTAINIAMVSGIVPGALNVAGVFFLGWGFYQAMVLYSAGLFASMGISMYPLYKHRGEQQQQALSAA